MAMSQGGVSRTRYSSVVPTVKPHPGAGQLLAAVDSGDAEMVFKLLHAKKVFANVCNKHGETPLHIAAGAGNLDIVKILCDYHATVDMPDKRGDTPLYWAARHGHLEVVEYLAAEGADINNRDWAKETALHVSARYDQYEVLSYLCKVGAKLDLSDEHGDTPLLCGAWHGYQGIVECLVEAGCSLQASNKDEETPLHVAAVRGYFSIVQFLCEKGANLNAIDKLGCTPLQLAVRRNRLDVVKCLCGQHCELNYQNVNGDTALHDACREGEISIFMALLDAKCETNLSNKNGCTPLHLAAKYGHRDLVRHLCIAGCDINAVNTAGKTPDLMAFESSDSELASMIHHLRQYGYLEQYVADMLPEQVSVSRTKLFVCGSTGVGKTELIKSLKCRFLRSLFRRRSVSNIDHMIQQRTHGILVQQVAIPNAGNFSVWDFSGLKSYYILHEEFLRLRNALILLVFKVNDPVDQQLSELRFWLGLVKAKQPPSLDIRFAGERKNKPYVVLVSSFANLPTVLPDELTVPARTPMRGNAPPPDPNKMAEVLATIKEEFMSYFTFSDQMFQLDCRLSQSPEMKALRLHLGVLRCQIVKLQPKIPKFVDVLAQAIPEWRSLYETLPVLTWPQMLEKTRQYINPLVSESLMVDAVSALHDMGEVVYIKEGPPCNIVILDPVWLGLRIFGPALSPENTIITQLKSMTGYVNLSTLQRVYPELDPVSAISLFEHFQLCTPVDANRFNFLFPCLIKMEPIHGLWEKSSEFTVYSGVRVTCQASSDIFSPSVFAKIQIQSRKAFSHDIEDQELTMWRGGLKCCRGEVEIMLSYPELGKCIEILVRGTEETRLECYTLLQQFYKIVTKTISNVNPGTSVMTEVLSSKRLQEHKPVLWYSPMEIFAAERGDGVLRHAHMPDQEETILDVVCCGCQELLIATRSAPYTLTSDLPVHTKVELSRLIDPPDSLGRDWCLLALQLLFTEEVPKISNADDGSSPTSRLLAEWEKSLQSNVVAVIDALRVIGREDAASTLIKGLCPYSNPSSSVIINISDVPMTSFLC